MWCYLFRKSSLFGWGQLNSTPENNSQYQAIAVCSSTASYKAVAVFLERLDDKEACFELKFLDLDRLYFNYLTLI